MQNFLNYALGRHKSFANSHRVLAVVMLYRSRQVRALATRQDDSQWSGYVYWVVASTFYAEENFISQSESDEMPLVNLFGSAYQSMFRDAISVVGNYGEMYARSVEEFVPRDGRNLPNVVPLGPQHYPLPGL